MPIVRTEAEIRELLTAVKSAVTYKKQCDCEVCTVEVGGLVLTADTLNWLLGEPPSEDFQEIEGVAADFELGFVQMLITRHKLGEFASKIKGTG